MVVLRWTRRSASSASSAATSGDGGAGTAGVELLIAWLLARAVGGGGLSGQPHRPRSLRSLATWPVALTLYRASETFPCSSTTNVDRMTPWTVLP